MKITYILAILVVFAWPLYYLYQLQLGAVSFLLLAIFFLIVTIKEMKNFTEPNEKKIHHSKKEKIKRNSR